MVLLYCYSGLHDIFTLVDFLIFMSIGSLSIGILQMEDQMQPFTDLVLLLCLVVQ